jgi:hypothetical protein
LANAKESCAVVGAGHADQMSMPITTRCTSRNSRKHGVQRPTTPSAEAS